MDSQEEINQFHEAAACNYERVLLGNAGLRFHSEEVPFPILLPRISFDTDTLLHFDRPIGDFAAVKRFALAYLIREVGHLHDLGVIDNNLIIAGILTPVTLQSDATVSISGLIDPALAREIWIAFAVAMNE